MNSYRMPAMREESFYQLKKLALQEKMTFVKFMEKVTELAVSQFSNQNNENRKHEVRN